MKDEVKLDDDGLIVVDKNTDKETQRLQKEFRELQIKSKKMRKEIEEAMKVPSEVWNSIVY